MGVGFRVFLISPDDSLQRIPQARFERFFKSDSEEQFTEFAGQKVKCAMVFVETSNRKPVTVMRIDYMLIQLDENGRLDSREHHRHLRLNMTRFGGFSMPGRKENRSLRNAQEHWAKSQIEREFKWIPSPELDKAIRSAALKR